MFYKNINNWILKHVYMNMIPTWFGFMNKLFIFVNCDDCK